MSSTTATTTLQLSNHSDITSRDAHDAAVARAQDLTNPVPTLIFVSSSNPASVDATPKFLSLAEKMPEAQFYTMELTKEISPMIKFGPQNCPIFIVMKGRRCETVLGWRGLEAKAREVLES